MEKNQKKNCWNLEEKFDWFKHNCVKAVLVACNTSSANTLNVLKNEYDFEIFGLIEPAARHVAELYIKRVGLIATSATVRSKAYSNTIKMIDPSKEVVEIACPGLVEIVEENKVYAPESKELIRRYINQLLQEKVEKIILGCTHYPFLSHIIDEIIGNPDILIDPADFIVKAAKAKLQALNLLETKSEGSRQYYVSSNPQKFVETAHKFYSDCIMAKELNLSRFYLT